MTYRDPGTVMPQDRVSREKEHDGIASALIVRSGSIGSSGGTTARKLQRLLDVMKHMDSSQYEVTRRAFHAVLASPDQKPGVSSALVKAISDFDCERVGFIADYHHLKPEDMTTIYYLRLITSLVRLEREDSVSCMSNLEAHLEADKLFPEDNYTYKDYYYEDKQMIRIVNERPDRVNDIHEFFSTRAHRDRDGINTTLLDEYLSHKSLADGWL